MGREDVAQVMQGGVVPVYETRTSSLKSVGSGGSNSIRRKPVPSFDFQIPASQAPAPPPKEQDYRQQLADKRISDQSAFSFERNSDSSSVNVSREAETAPRSGQRDFVTQSAPVSKSIAYGHTNIENSMHNLRISQTAEISTIPQVSEPTQAYDDRLDRIDDEYEYQEHQEEVVPQLQYFHQMGNESSNVNNARSSPNHHMQSPSRDSQSSSEHGQGLQLPQSLQRPSSAYMNGEYGIRGRQHSPHLSVGGSPNGSPILQGRGASATRRSPDVRPSSYVDLLNIPYSQQITLAPTAGIGNSSLRNVVGQNASLLDTKKTLEMYRANVKKIANNEMQYEFALFMVQVARDQIDGAPGSESSGMDPNELLKEARIILQRLSDRSYPFAQYYLADGYASGLFNKGKEDYDRAFPLFVAASKHGHAESGYRAALCYEFGWGCRKDYPKAVQFYRASASRNHPGAATRLGKACLTGDMGITDKYREGLKWLKRAAESADGQYNAGPYELGLLHENGFGPDLFKDEAYAAQLFTQAADLGNPHASLKMGEAYEHGLLCCPRDPALSVHFYNGAAQGGLPEAMMNLCAWYMVGAEPVLDKDENEAYEWAKRAAELGLAKAEYALGYFTEMGIGCRRDPLEANVWYVRAADQGDERARQRLAIIRAAASGERGPPPSASTDRKLKKDKDDKDCVIM